MSLHVTRSCPFFSTCTNWKWSNTGGSEGLRTRLHAFSVSWQYICIYISKFCSWRDPLFNNTMLISFPILVPSIIGSQLSKGFHSISYQNFVPEDIQHHAYLIPNTSPQDHDWVKGFIQFERIRHSVIIFKPCCHYVVVISDSCSCYY